jgi:hypothetical protein
VASIWKTPELAGPISGEIGTGLVTESTLVRHASPGRVRADFRVPEW